MQQNTPMKRQFTTIDGRTVMSNLPQHWGGNDWKITGVDNPLPVGNYVQTEAGVWIPQKGSDDGAADVRITGSIVEDVQVKKEQILVERSVKNSNVVLMDIGTPKGAKGAMFALGIAGVTGTFSSNQGIQLEAGFYQRPAPNGHFLGAVTEIKTVPGTHMIFWYPGATSNDFEATTNNSSLAVVGLPLPTTVRIRILISGSFNTGEGFDCQLVVNWFY